MKKVGEDRPVIHRAELRKEAVLDSFYILGGKKGRKYSLLFYTGCIECEWGFLISRGVNSAYSEMERMGGAIPSVHGIREGFL